MQTNMSKRGQCCALPDCSVVIFSAVAFFLRGIAFQFAANVWVGGFGFLGKLWSSILSSCLMEQDTSLDNVMGCETVGRLCFCQTGVTGGFLLKHFTQKANWKREGKFLANNSCLSPGFPSQGPHFLITLLQFFCNFCGWFFFFYFFIFFVFFFFQQSSKAFWSEPSLLNARGCL